MRMWRKGIVTLGEAQIGDSETMSVKADVADEVPSCSSHCRNMERMWRNAKRPRMGTGRSSQNLNPAVEEGLVVVPWKCSR